jgi:hypothetical protein
VVVSLGLTLYHIVNRYYINGNLKYVVVSFVKVVELNSIKFNRKTFEKIRNYEVFDKIIINRNSIRENILQRKVYIHSSNKMIDFKFETT